MNQWNFPSYNPNQTHSQQPWGQPYMQQGQQQPYHQQTYIQGQQPNQQQNIPYGQTFSANQPGNTPNTPPKSPYEQFAKPPLPMNWYQQQSVQQQMPNQKQAAPQGPKNVMTYFQDENGQLDLDKMLSTVGQMVNTVNQVSPLVKGIGSFMKGIK